jgi:DNA-binding transcriptional regulator YhcF (GntR family)
MSVLSARRRKTKPIDADSPMPRFYQVAEHLSAMLRDGDFRRGQRFTTVREVAADYGVSFVTAQRALSQLAEQRLILSERGRGTTVLVSSPRRKRKQQDSKVHQPAVTTRRLALLWPTHLPVATAIRSNLLATIDGLRSALPSYSVSLEFAGELLHEHGAQDYLDSLVSGSNLSAFGLLCAPSFVKRYFELRQVPTVVLGNVEPGIKLSCVSSDEEQAQYDLTRHLLDMGHRRIVQVIAAPRVAGHEPRLRGYRQAMMETSKTESTWREDWELLVPPDRDEAMARIETVLRDPKPPTAAICTGLSLASWIKAAAGEAFHVAYDVDREPTHASVTPSTVLIWPGERMGRLAGELLTQQIDGDFNRRQEVLGYSQIKDYK